MEDLSSSPVHSALAKTTASTLLALVVADDKLADLIPEYLFERSRGKAIYVKNMQQAENCLSLSLPDTVFMPLLLDGTSTLPLLKKLKRLDPSPVIVVIAQSDQINLAAEAMHAGVFECLFQPFSQGRLEHTIRSVAETLLPPLADPSSYADKRPDNGLSNLVGRSFAEIEQLVIEETIRIHGGSIPKAANTLGLSPSTIYRKRENWNK